MKNRLPKTHVCDCSYARKERKRGRINGGFIFGKKKWENKEDKLISKEGEGIIVPELTRKG